SDSGAGSASQLAATVATRRKTTRPQPPRFFISSSNRMSPKHLQVGGQAILVKEICLLGGRTGCLRTRHRGEAPHTTCYDRPQMSPGLLAILVAAASALAVPLDEAKVKATVDRWLAAQNQGDFAAYGSLYAPSFTGIRRSGAKTVSLD